MSALVKHILCKLLLKGTRIRDNCKKKPRETKISSLIIIMITLHDYMINNDYIL